MKTCLRIPRLFYPEERCEEWCSAPDDPFPPLDKLSARSCLPPCGEETDEEDEGDEGNEGEDKEEDTLLAIRENMYTALTSGTIKRLDRGMVLVKRTTRNGVRKGLLAAADLEEYAPEGSKTAMIRATTETDPAAVEALARFRENSVFELSTVVLSYRDRRDKILSAIEEEEFEQIYDISPRGERLEGFFIPEFISAEIIKALHRYATPCFGVLDGNHALAAAKLHWERVRAKISGREAINHPARFALAEFVNLYNPAVLAETPEGEPVKKDDLVSHWKSGKRYPANSMRLSAPRFLMEAREISYD